MVALRCVGNGANRRCGCEQGYGNDMMRNARYFNCAPCDKGKTSFEGRQSACHACRAGKYADEKGSLVAPHAALESILKAWGRQMSLNAWTVLWANLLLRLVTHAFRVLREHAAPIRE